jgi:L-lactate dehydrogenase
LKYINLTIIGCGNVGAELLFLLMLHPQPLKINILEPDKGREGAMLDIFHINGLENQHVLFINNFDLVPDVDFIFHTAGSCNKPNEKRGTVAESNVKLTKTIFKEIQFAKSPYIIVITNPVDLICYSLSLLHKNLEGRIVGTGTFLDTLRLNYYTAHELNCRADEVNGWILGEHGDSMVPVFSKTFIKEKPVMEVAYLKQLDAIALNTVKAAAQIRKTQSGTWYGVAYCAYIIFKNILERNNGPFSLCIKTNDYYRELLKTKEDIYIGLPALFDGNEFIPDNNFEMNSMERELLQTSAAKLLSNYKNIRQWVNE